MSASASDYFQKVGRATATTLSSPGYSISDTSINVASTTNWPTDTGVTFAIDEVDSAGERVSGTYNVFRGVVSSSTQISSLTYVGGDANRDYSAGATTRVYILVSAYRDNRFVDGMAVEHKQTGAHSDITADSIVIADGGTLDVDTINEATSANGVAIDGMTIKDGAVVGASGKGVLNSSLGTGAGELGGAWQSWTPTWTNLTVGNGTLSCAYTRIGNTIIARVSLVFGSTTSISGSAVAFTFPVTPSSSYGANHFMGTVRLQDANGADAPGSLALTASGEVLVTRGDATGSSLLDADLSSTTPFTWTTSDAIKGTFIYEAA